MKLFTGHEGAHGTHGTPVREGLKWIIKATARTIREPVTEDMWEKHLAGKRPLGVVPIRENSTCSWGSIDVDEYDIDLLSIITRVEQAKLPLVPCRSKSGGLHLWLFLKEAVPAGQVQAVLKDWAAQLGLSGCEIFPKQTQMLTDKGDVGNWMVMPYYGDTYNGKIKEQVGLKKTGSEMELSEFLRASEAAAVTEEEMATLGQRRSQQANKARRMLPGSKEPSNVNDFSDGPPCLQNMILDGGIQRGGQSNTLLHMGVYYKRANPADWEKRLERANQEFLSPPGSTEGLLSVLRSLRKKDYEYLCKTEPMCSHCNSSVCRTRKYGVGDGGNVPIITSLSKLDTEPVVWFVDVEGKRLECSTDQLQNYMLFQKLCIERLEKSYAPIKMGEWFAILNAALQNVVLLPVPSDIARGGWFHELMEEFLTNRAKGNQREDILSGRPWECEEDQRHYFRLKDFQKFLNREGVKELNRPQISNRIRDMGGDRYQMRIKGRNADTWYVPAEVIKPLIELDPPPIPAPPI
jgi:hypothetical protein